MRSDNPLVLVPPDAAEHRKLAETFETAARTAHFLRELLAHHQPFHDKLAAMALQTEDGP